MRKAIVPSIILLFFLVLPALAQAPPQPDPITLKSTPVKGEWTMVNPDGGVVGTLKTVEDGGWAIVRPDGAYAGVITSDGKFMKSGRRPVFSADEARLFLDTLQALKKIK